MKVASTVWLLVWVMLTGVVPVRQAYAQARPTTPAPADTLRPAPVNPPTDSIRVGNSTLTTETSAVDSLGATPLTPKQEALRRKIIPRQATIRSLILPGLGQLYNRDYWKIPLVYAGLGVSLYFLIDNNNQYLRFENAYRVAYGDTTKGSGNGTADVYVRSRGAVQTLNIAQLRTATNIYHRYRDLNVIITVALWAINAVEANVAAHLKTFDLSDDLSLRVQPNLHPAIGGPPVPGFRLTLNFKK